MTAAQFVTRPYVYADGKVYRDNLKLIRPLVNGAPSVESVGGLVICRDKFFAFASDHACMLVQCPISTIIQQAKAYAWGSTKMEALAKIRPNLRGADPAYRPGDKPRETVSIGDFSTMIALFDGAKADKKGPPYAKILCEDMTIKLSVSKPGTKAPGTINVSTGSRESNRWFGRILRDGSFEKNSRETAPAALDATLREFAKDPKNAMIAFGRRTGACAICSRTLTKGESIDRGIGPICFSRFFGE